MSFTDRVISLCETAPEGRNEEEIEFLARWIESSSSYFRKLRNKDAIREIVRDCHLQRFHANELIIRQGEKGHSFYLVITGRVSVYVNSDAEQASEPVTAADASASGAGGPNQADRDPEADADDADEDVDLAFLDDANKLASHGEDAEELRSRLLGAHVLQMGEGYAFGEIALTSPNSIRKASVICDEDVAVLVIHQVSFARTLKAYQLQEYQMIESFIDTCPVFVNWRPKQRQSLRNSLHKEVYGYGEPIVQQGQKSGGLFFIVGGSVKLLADPIRWPASIQKSEKDEQSSAAPAATPAPAAAAVQAGLLRHRQGYQAAEQRQRSRQVEIALLGEGEILGQVELLASLGESLTTAISVDNTYGYWLNRANCRRLLSRNRGALAQLRQTILLRLHQLGPAPADASLYYRHLCRVNAERRRHLRERSRPAKLVASLQNEDEEEARESELDSGQPQLKMWQQQQQQRRRTVPRSRRLLQRELEASEKGIVSGLEYRQPAAAFAANEANRAAFRPTDAGKGPGDSAGAANAPPSAAWTTSNSGVPRLLTDFELSKAHLRLIERRIEAFCTDTAGVVYRRPGVGAVGGGIGGNVKGQKPHVEPLLRLPDVEIQKPRLRGSRVLVKTKQCPASNANGQMVLGHSHVTNHLVQSLPDWDQKVLRTRRERLRQLEQMSSA
uniref:Cyclic nucleotide-binding domain-containing protein n=1 Tax=Macrostomum lignano TaxID=282301 RepID=A0A1I8HP58_9PLAT